MPFLTVEALPRFMASMSPGVSAPSLLMIVTLRSMAAAVSLPFSVLTRGTHPHAAGRQLDQISKSGIRHSVIRRNQSPTSSNFFVVSF